MQPGKENSAILKRIGGLICRYVSYCEKKFFLMIKEFGMSCPDLKVEDVQEIFTDANDIELLDRGGQKIVFTGVFSGTKYALKFMKPESNATDLEEQDFLDSVMARAEREVETMRQCMCAHLVKMGPVGLKTCTIGNSTILYYSEEYIEGSNLKQYFRSNGVFSVDDLILLGIHISDAISELWQFAKIHRDIKPGNIMRKSDGGSFVLLDMGLVFDLQDQSLSIGPVGTPLYVSPEQLDFNNRRSIMDFRSDLFSLGIVLYQMSTGQHPFTANGAISNWQVMGNIKTLIPPSPNSLRDEIPAKLSDVIMRLLAKRPALRYRSIEQFQKALNEVQAEGDSI